MSKILHQSFYFPKYFLVPILDGYRVSLKKYRWDCNTWAPGRQKKMLATRIPQLPRVVTVTLDAFLWRDWVDRALLDFVIQELVPAAICLVESELTENCFLVGVENCLLFSAESADVTAFRASRTAGAKLPSRREMWARNYRWAHLLHSHLECFIYSSTSRLS